MSDEVAPNGVCLAAFGRYGVFSTLFTLGYTVRVIDALIAPQATSLDNIKGGELLGEFPNKEDAEFFARNKFFVDHPQNKPIGVNAYIPPSSGRDPTYAEIVAFAEWKAAADKVNDEIIAAMETPIYQMTDEQHVLFMTQLAPALQAAMPVGNMIAGRCGYLMLLVDSTETEIHLRHITNINPTKEIPSFLRVAANRLEPELDPDGYAARKAEREKKKSQGVVKPKIILP